MNKAERLNKELIFLNNKHTFQLNDLMTEFKISKRTAQRDLDNLQAMGLPFYSELGRAGGYKIINQYFHVPIYFNYEEIQAIFFALNALTRLSSTPFEASYKQIREKMMTIIHDGQQKQIEKLLEIVEYWGTAPVSAPIFLSKIMKAVIENKGIKIQSMQYGPQNYELQVATLYYRNGIWMISAYDIISQNWGDFRCDEIISCHIFDLGKHYKSLEQLKRERTVYFKKYRKIPFSCSLTSSGKEHFLKNHYPNMSLQNDGDAYHLTGYYSETELALMAHYLISFGKELTIEFPTELKNAYINQLKYMINQN